MKKFSINPEILDQIIFAMENQNDSFVFDANDCCVKSPGADVSDDLHDDEESGMYTLPEWTPADGFNLMEKFTAVLRNPVYREQLREALNSGKGVFRNFKNVVKQREDIQRMWFSFKDREMKNRVIEWYNDLCEAWGVEKTGLEPAETEELLLSDFFFRFSSKDENSEDFLDCDRAGFMEAMASFPGEFGSLLYEMRRDTFPVEKEAWSFFICETPAGELAGILWFVDDMECDYREDTRVEITGVCSVLQLYVKPEYRGLGLARGMLEQFMRQSWKKGSRRIVLNLWGQALGMGNILEEYGFTPFCTGYSLDVREWGRKNQ